MFGSLKKPFSNALPYRTVKAVIRKSTIRKRPNGLNGPKRTRRMAGDFYFCPPLPSLVGRSGLVWCGGRSCLFLLRLAAVVPQAVRPQVDAAGGAHDPLWGYGCSPQRVFSCLPVVFGHLVFLSWGVLGLGVLRPASPGLCLWWSAVGLLPFSLSSSFFSCSLLVFIFLFPRTAKRRSHRVPLAPLTRRTAATRSVLEHPRAKFFAWPPE